MSYPYGQPGYPAPYGQPYQPYGAPPPPQPSGGTAITAGVLAIGVGLLTLVGSIGLFAYAAEGPTFKSGRHYTGIFTGLATVLLVLTVVYILGAILLLCRKTAGRVLLILISSLGAIFGVVGIAIAAGNGGFVPSSGIGFVIQLTILILASVSSTGRWIAAGRQPAPYPYPAPPPYGQPPYPPQPYGQPPNYPQY
ncbi:hypothetical protein [Nocardia sp. NPDC052566]|uniref:hypothetical protein n=1 Tax=Nocardia sp. NPDC052566 TaxID=3364330 RepID=UPI0037C56DC6